MHRINYEHRHKVHLSLILDNHKDFELYNLKCRNRTSYGEVIKANANDFNFFHDEKLLEIISSFLNDEYYHESIDYNGKLIAKKEELYED